MALFQVYKDRGEHWRWRLQANNTQIVAISSGSFDNKEECIEHLEDFIELVPEAEEETVSRE